MRPEDQSPDPSPPATLPSAPVVARRARRRRAGPEARSRELHRSRLTASGVAVGAAVVITGGIALANPAPGGSDPPAVDGTPTAATTAVPRFDPREFGRASPYRDFDDDRDDDFRTPPNPQTRPSAPTRPNTRSRGS